MKRLSTLAIALLMSPLCFAQIPAYVPTNGLVMFLPFNGNANDASGYGNNGIVTGCTSAAGQSGVANTAYKFNGTGNYIRVPHSGSIDTNRKLTMYAKIHVDGFFQGNCHGNDIMDKAASDFAPGLYSLRFAPSNSNGNCAFQDTTHQNYMFEYGSLAPSYAVMNNPPYIQKGGWDNVISTYDGDTAKMYVNGVLRHTFASTAGIGSNIHDLFIGMKDDPSYEYYFNGSIDDIALWNRALSACEVSRMYFGNYITTQPVDKYAATGTSTAFTVVSSMGAAARYQWQVGTGTTYINLVNGGQYNGVLTNTLTVSGINATNQNQFYRCLVSDSSNCFKDTTTAAKLTTNVGVENTMSSVGFLGQNMPNPAYGGTIINYGITKGNTAAIIVYDYQGRTICAQQLPVVQQGSVKIGNLNAGIYFYVLQVDGYKLDTKKMIILE